METKALTVEQIKANAEKEAIQAMTAAKVNMERALSRNNKLESCIANLNAMVDEMIKLIPEGSYIYNGQKTHRTVFWEKRKAIMEYI